MRTSRWQNVFTTLGFYSSGILWAVSSTLSSTSITTTISLGIEKLVKLKCLEGGSKFFIGARKRTKCNQESSAVTVPTLDLTLVLTTLMHIFFLTWFFFSSLCDLTSFDSSLQNFFHRNNSLFSNFILRYLGIKSRFQQIFCCHFFFPFGMHFHYFQPFSRFSTSLNKFHGSK